MFALLCFVLAVLASPFKSKSRLEAENVALRHQLIVLRRKVQGRVRLTNNDRWFFIQLYRWFPSILQVLTIIRPETLVRWHRAGFRCYWRWKSRSLGGRPTDRDGPPRVDPADEHREPALGRQVVGSSTATQFQVQNSSPVLLKIPRVESVEDGPGKPVAINRFIGQRPIFAFGNSDGDKEMLEWTEAGGGLRFMGIVHHTDADREWAYDRDSDVGHLDKVLDEANAKGWTIVDMKRDWNVVFPPRSAPSGRSCS
jgi:hypothetical protein